MDFVAAFESAENLDLREDTRWFETRYNLLKFDSGISQPQNAKAGCSGPKMDSSYSQPLDLA